MPAFRSSFSILFFFVFFSFQGFAQEKVAQETDTVFLKTLLSSYPQYFKNIVEHPEKNEVQILYTQVNRDRHNLPHFKTFSFHLNEGRYFYPASTVKLPTLIFALEKLNALNVPRLTMNSVMRTDSDFKGQVRITTDTSSETGFPSLAHYIRRILLVSDNSAYNRVYEFTGRNEINKELKRYDLNNSRIVGRLAVGDSGEFARHTNPISFFSGTTELYKLTGEYDKGDYPISKENMMQGTGYINKTGNLIMQPFDFRQSNVFTLADQQSLMKRLIFPEAYAPSQRFKISEEQYAFIYKYMSMYANESTKPDYPSLKNFPAYCKFLFYGGDSTARIDSTIRIFNKVGDSYGYMIDNAYIIDFPNKVEFLVTAVIQSNEDGIYNDNKYEYDTVCLPFLKNLGIVLLDYERKRARKYKPELSKFKFRYR